MAYALNPVNAFKTTFAPKTPQQTAAVQAAVALNPVTAFKTALAPLTIPNVDCGAVLGITQSYYTQNTPGLNPGMDYSNLTLYKTNRIGNNTCDIKIIGIPKGTQITSDKRRFSYSWNPTTKTWNVSNMGVAASGSTVEGFRNIDNNWIGYGLIMIVMIILIWCIYRNYCKQ